MTIEIDFTEKDIEDYLCRSGNLMKHLDLRFVARQVDILFNYDFENGIGFYWYNRNEREFHNKLKEHLYE